MRHTRQYADVDNLRNKPSDVGFLGIERGTEAIVILLLIIGFIGAVVGFGLKGIAWPLG